MAASREPIVLRSWPALLVAPLLALGMQSLAYSLVTPSCAHDGGGVLHVVAAAALLLAVALTAVAATAWRRAREAKARAPAANVETMEGPRDLFLGRVATLTGAFSALAIAAMWIPVWMLPPCL